MDILETRTNFQSLSVKDLLEARDLYHYHLLHKKNVIGTAIGLYLIRDDEPRPPDDRSAAVGDNRKSLPKGERRFDNSSVRDYSWPCVIVVVRDWHPARDFGGEHGKFDAQDMVPKTLYLPDGRTVPVCVVKATPAEADGSDLPDWHWPNSVMGGGFPLLVDVQQQERVASVGCLVSDGHLTYALTNRHVCGSAGEPVYSIVRGRRVLIGRASDKQFTRLLFSKVYPDYPARRSYLNLDVGLIALDDLNDWTSEVYGIGEIGELADISEQNITLRLIDAGVIAHGAASGQMKGTIKALFYRYKSVGGYDYISDFLIAPTDGQSQTRHGDSGTVWHLMPDTDNPLPRPLCIEWGGQTLLHGDTPGQFQFALATSLSNVCKLLDVELVRAHNTGFQPYWGKMGHYSIGTFACEIVHPKKLNDLFKDNEDRVSFEKTFLSAKDVSAALKEAKDNDDFIPLADVPDLVWKNFPQKIAGGRDDRSAGMGRSTGPEHPTHYADIDQPRADGKTLIQLCLEDTDNIDVDFWRHFYDDTGRTQQHERGLLPFRVWQFFDAMVEFVAAENVTSYLCAAGLLAHYVGDACQPLHGSMLADGYADHETTVTVHHRDGTTSEEKSHLGAGVHSAYETNMIDRFTPQLRDGLEAALAQVDEPQLVTTGKEAAIATIKLMNRTAALVQPKNTHRGLHRGRRRQAGGGLRRAVGEIRRRHDCDDGRRRAHAGDVVGKRLGCRPGREDQRQQVEAPG